MTLIRRLLIAAFAASLALALPHVPPSRATVQTSSNKTIVLGDGTTTIFNFNFVGVASAYISVIYTDASGNETVLTQGSGTTQYQISLNAPVTGAVWGIGGTVTYSPSGTPIANGTTLTIFRTLPLTQAISLQNQNSLARLGNGAETGLDTGVMQSQQISETIARAIVAPIVDATPPAPLPPIAQRANMGAAFDGQGNLVAGTIPSSGVISSAMAPVVDAATLAIARTALGLGNIATETMGCGLADDGAGNVQLTFPVTQVAINTAIHKANCFTSYITSGPITLTLDRANTLFPGFGFWVYNSAAGALTVAPNAADTFQFKSSGQAIILPPSSSAYITTDAAGSGNWYAQYSAVRSGPTVCDIVSTSATTCNNGGSSANNGTYTTPAGALYLRLRMVGPAGGGAGAGAGGTGGSGANGAAAATFGSFSAGAGQGGVGGASGGSAPGAGGTVSGCDININGSTGVGTIANSGSGGTGGDGGDAPFFGGRGAGARLSGNGSPGATNTGGGGGGAAQVSTSASGGPGGGSGAYCEKVIASPGATFSYTAPAGGAGGAAGGSGNTGGAGASAHLIVEAYYN